MNVTKREKMISFWSKRAELHGGDVRANTDDIWLREIEIAYVDQVLKADTEPRVLDFGCANGYSTIRLAQANPQAVFLGVDTNPDMIRVARSAGGDVSNLAFRQLDVMQEPTAGGYQLIYAIRVFQNIESPEAQRHVFDRLHELLEPNGLFLYIESYADGYARLNDDRVKLGLAPLPIHEHLTLLTDEFDRHVARKMTLARTDHLSSSYYLATRLLYSYLAHASDEAIDYNHPIHQVAAILPQIGDYGPQKASLYRKREAHR